MLNKRVIPSDQDKWDTCIPERHSTLTHKQHLGSKNLAQAVFRRWPVSTSARIPISWLRFSMVFLNPSHKCHKSTLKQVKITLAPAFLSLLNIIILYHHTMPSNHCCWHSIIISIILTFSHNILTQLTFPERHAKCKGVEPKLSGFCKSTPEYCNKRIKSAWPEIKQNNIQACSHIPVTKFHQSSVSCWWLLHRAIQFPQLWHQKITLKTCVLFYNSQLCADLKVWY
jgi:hypothetical protein